MYTKEIWVLRNDSPCSPSDNPLWLHYLGQRVTNFYPCWWTSAVAEPSLLAERLSFSWAWYSKTVSQDWSGNKIYANMLATSQWDPLRPVWRHQLSYGLRGPILRRLTCTYSWLQHQCQYNDLLWKWELREKLHDRTGCCGRWPSFEHIAAFSKNQVTIQDLCYSMRDNHSTVPVAVQKAWDSAAIVLPTALLSI